MKKIHFQSKKREKQTKTINKQREPIDGISNIVGYNSMKIYFVFRDTELAGLHSQMNSTSWGHLILNLQPYCVLRLLMFSLSIREQCDNLTS